MRSLAVASVTLSAFLLFLVQPLAARMLLPHYGGSPAVWGTALVFFQVLLLAGYAYAHSSLDRIPTPLQTTLHSGLLLLPLLVLPPALEGAGPGADAWPVPSLLLALTVAVGAPFFVLASNGPLVQRWYSLSSAGAGRDPYVLYAASNAGSLAALLLYPLALEPLLGVSNQGWVFAGGYALFALGTGVLGWRIGQELRGTTGTATGTATASASVSGTAATATATATTRSTDELPDPKGSIPRQVKEAEGLRGGVLEYAAQASPKADAEMAWKGPLRGGSWLALSALGSALLLAESLQITTDVASTPLLWVAPLALYLLTFIIAFGPGIDRFRMPLRVAVAAGVTLSLAALVRETVGPAWVLLAIHLGTLFCGCLLCHGLLAERRPPASGLTRFYLVLSIGGALGGTLAQFVAPLLFDSLVELPVALALLAVVALQLHAPDDPRRAHLKPSPGPLVAVVVVVTAVLVWAALGDPVAGEPARRDVVVLPLLAGMAWLARPWAFPAVAVLTAGFLLAGAFHGGRQLESERGFFGVVRVFEADGQRWMQHGTTVHGSQWLDAPRRGLPTTYYAPGGPMGSLVSAAANDARVCLVGMGAGSLSVLTKPGQQLTWFEIDPVVDRLARRWFTYLDDAPAPVDVVLGDARRSLAAEVAGEVAVPPCDLLVIDAFSSDAVPVHLLTREAMALYLQRLAPDGRLVFHISNRSLDLRRPVLGLAQDAGLHLALTAWIPSPAELDDGAQPSRAALLSRQPLDLAALPDVGWAPPPGDLAPLLWTDERSSLLRAWKRAPARTP